MAKKARKAQKKARRSAAPNRKKAKKTTRPKAGASNRKKAGAAKRKKPGAAKAKKTAAGKTARAVKKQARPPVSARPKVKRSTGSPAGAGDTRRAPSLERERRRLRDVEESVPQSPSSLNLDRHGSAARSGRAALEQARHNHTETSPALTGGDVDADWEDAYAVGDEAPGGDNPTPDQDRVDDIGRALGIQYADNEELKAADKISKRDKRRWELDPASAEDYPDHEE
jgi:hypothetical protein